jgi:hypothetical protein
MVDLAPTIAEIIGFDGWPQRAGRVLEEALVPGAPRPRVVVTLVWDGGGDNVLNAHAGSWPYLARLMNRGMSWTKMTIGSTPSTTPPIHATLGTGVWPSEHGIVAVKQLDGGEYSNPWPRGEPANLETATLGDLYDRARNNVPKIALVAAHPWHLGMLGHGSATPGGDADLAVLLTHFGRSVVNSGHYESPLFEGKAQLEEEVTALDPADGARDDRWNHLPLDDPDVVSASPAFVAFQQRVIENLILDHGIGDDEVPDLLFVNMKSPDRAGHEWGATSNEVGAVVRAADAALRRLVRFLNERVGRENWVLLLTADHGQMLYPHQSGGYAIGGRKLGDDLNDRFVDTNIDSPLVNRVTAHGAYLSRNQLRADGVNRLELARWLLDYTVSENLNGDPLPDHLRRRQNERLFDAIVIRGRRAVLNC